MFSLLIVIQILLSSKAFYSPTLAIKPPSSLAINQQKSSRNIFSIQKNCPSLHHPLLACRGGEIMDTTADDDANTIIKSSADTITNALVNGPHLQGIAALYLVSAITVTLFTMIRASFSFSVGYGGSVAAMALALIMAFGVPFIFPSQGNLMTLPGLLAHASLLYGVRLAVYLAFRRWTVPSIRSSTSKTDEIPRPKRIMLALSVSMLYTFMMTPVLYALRRGKIDENTPNKIQSAGVIIAYIGLFIEAISDMHKYIVKWQNNAEYGSEVFVGPTSGTFLLCRHPSFFGEMAFWFGLFLGGTVAFGKSIPAWLCSTLGLFGISSVMMPSSKRLDQRQLEKYGGQEKYDFYRSKVKGSLFPSF